MKKTMLAFDLGGSGCKTMLARFNGRRLEMIEAGRFPNRPVWIGNQLYWDFPFLLRSVKEILAQHWHSEGGIDAYGIDTWGTSYGLIDSEGRLLSLPLHYRGLPFAGITDEVYALVPQKRIRMETACYPSEDITLFGLYGQMRYNSGLFRLAHKALMIPDLLQFFLTGQAIGEKTIVGTGGVLHPYTQNLNVSLLDALGLSTGLFPAIQEAGTLRGELTGDVQNELGIKSVKAVATAEHDTQAAVAALNLEDEETAYLICGTWSLFGVETVEPYTDNNTLDRRFCNEIGVADRICFLLNIQGMWLYEQCLAQWGMQDPKNHHMLALQADKAMPLVRLVDTDNELFYTTGDMPRRIQEYCRSSEQPVPETKGEIVRCIFESLCCKYRLALEGVRKSTGRTITKLRVGGGGSGNDFLMQITADALGCRVLAGPKEASGFGNVMVQLMALGEVKDLWQGRELVAESCGVTEYEPHNRDGWEEAMDRYHRILKRYAEKSKTQGI